MSQALQFVEVDLPRCALTYGVAPCTASIPTTGSAKCFNALATCQDTANYTETTATLRFAVAAAYLPRDIDIVGPLLERVEYSPAMVSLGENLGQRASIKVTLFDQRHSDAGAGLDKYNQERGYDPYSRGSLFGRLRKRYPTLRGPELRWITGLLGEALADMETRHFFAESIDGVTPDGRFAIVAKDALKFLDGDRSQAPVLSNGFLNADITNSATAAVLSPAGIGNSEYPAAPFHVNIGGNEVCLVTARSGDNLTITRAQKGTTAAAHSAQDRVQVCLVYAAEDPAAILDDLVTNYTDTPAGYVPLAEWQTEVDNNLNRLYTATITEPTAVNKLVSELVQCAQLALWDDNEAQKLRLQVLRGIPTDAASFDESSILKDTFHVIDQPEKRYSQVWIYYGQIDPTKRVDDPDNYRSCKKVPDDPSASEALFGSPSILKVFARWIPALGSTIATSLGNKLLSRFTTPPRRFAFEVFRNAATVLPVLGGGYRLGWWSLQNADGSAESVPVQAVSILPGPASIKVAAEEMLFSAAAEDLTDRQIVIDSNINNVNLQEVHDSLFPALEVGQTVTCTIMPGVIVGSTSIATPAFDVGTWAGAPTLNIVILGRIQGKGGDGATSPAAGQNGGVALYTREAINLTDASGETWGGGAGGGAARDESANPFAGGGGGAGQSPGAGGGGTFAGQPGTTEAGGAAGHALAGAGGGPGLNGAAGVHTAGGTAGLAIDGISFVTTVGSPGDRRGGTAN